MIEKSSTENTNTPKPPNRSGHLPALASEDIYYFPEGLPGYESVKGFSIKVSKELEPFFLLESVSPAGIQFACVDPFLVCPEYDPRVSEDDLAPLHLENTLDGIFICLVSLDALTRNSTANLRGPILLSPRHRLARQVDVGRASESFTYPISHVFRYAQVHRSRCYQAPRATTPQQATTHQVRMVHQGNR